jgi:hypothetical protein
VTFVGHIPPSQAFQMAQKESGIIFFKGDGVIQLHNSVIKKYDNRSDMM